MLSMFLEVSFQFFEIICLFDTDCPFIFLNIMIYFNLISITHIIFIIILNKTIEYFKIASFNFLHLIPAHWACVCNRKPMTNTSSMVLMFTWKCNQFLTLLEIYITY
jgi:hypothetical protein